MNAFYAKDRPGWRGWLRKNSASSVEIWLLFFKKKSGKPSVSYDEAVEEALCFGWIDSIVKSVDEEKYAQKFTPRKPKAQWSESNIRRVKKMIAARQMTPAGLKAFEHHEERRPSPLPTRLPKSLEQRFTKASKAYANFKHFPPYYQRMSIGWVASAKKEETRAKRMKQLIEFSIRNERIKFI